MDLSLSAHIIAGSVGILTGFIALYTVKGARVHRKSGTVFVYSMLAMALLGGLMALLRHKAAYGNVPVAVFTIYLVVTALIAVKPPAVGAGRWDVSLMLLGFAITLTLLTIGSIAIGNPKFLRGFPPAPFFVFGTIALMANVGDVRLIRSGGVQQIRGAPRLARHLWRMSTALLIATFSFFIGQAKVFPKPIRIYPLLAIPPLIVLGVLLYWLWRVRIRQSLRGIVTAPTVRRPMRTQGARA
jgi:uncharacterized membrane protein